MPQILTDKIRSFQKVFAFGIALLLAACGGGSGSNIVSPLPNPPTNPPVATELAEVWVTTGDKAKLLAKDSDIKISDNANSATIINIDSTTAYQDFIGVGASITDATAYLINTKLAPNARAELMRELFTNNGIGINFTRLTIGASDFSQTHYSYNDMPKGQTDTSLEAFSLAPARENLIPVVRAAISENPNLKIMASPWSPPGWMKTSDSMIGGSLKPEFYDAYANYFLKYLNGMRAEGIEIFAITMQNEPSFSPTNYPGTIITPTERANIYKNHLGPLLAAKSPNTAIMEWDHNWDKPNEPMAVLADADAKRYINAVAWHCYGGSPSAQSQIYNAHPTIGTYFTECSGGEWDKNFASTLSWQTKNLVIGTTRNWAKGVLFWNLALDENFGPHLGGCGDCRGVITIKNNGEISRNVEYYVLGHVGKFVAPWAKRIKSDSEIDGIETVAFANPNNNGNVIVVLNSNNATKDFTIRHGNKNINYSLPPNSVATIKWGN